MGKRARVFSREFKVSVVHRILGGEPVGAVARELRVYRQDLHIWVDRFRAGGAEALRGRGRPPKAVAALRSEPVLEVDDVGLARQRIAELERKVGQQQLELDFFRQALRQVSGKRRPSDGPGATPSTSSSKR